MLEETQAEVPVLRPAVPFCITVQLTNQINGAQSLLEKLLVLQLVKKKFPAFYGTRRLINVFAGARHVCLS